LGDKRWIASCLESLAEVTSVLDDSLKRQERAALLFGAATVLREAIGAPVETDERDAHERKVMAVRAALGEAAFAAAWAEGHQMPLEQAVALAMDLPSPA
jgi:hypothetical protein